MNTENILKAYKKLSKSNTDISSLHTMVAKSDFTSIMYDRFISILAAEGIKWDGASISMEKLLENSGESIANIAISRISNTTSIDNIMTNGSVGIDIEHADNMPDASDYWENNFYNTNFTNSEIAHCAAKEDPKESFAGIYACKEAIFKSDADLRLNTYKELEIKFDDTGRPSCKGWSVSISHSKGICIAIAIKQLAITNNIVSARSQIENKETPVENKKTKRRFFFF